MLCVWWNYEGIVYFDLLEYGRTVNSELYKEQLTKLHEKPQSCYPTLDNRKRVQSSLPLNRKIGTEKE